MEGNDIIFNSEKITCACFYQIPTPLAIGNLRAKLPRCILPIIELAAEVKLLTPLCKSTNCSLDAADTNSATGVLPVRSGSLEQDARAT